MNYKGPLNGSCSCGRNLYRIQIPRDMAPTATPRVFFDNSSAHRTAQASPLTSWLRIPLTWYSSETHSFAPDETHTSIRRSYSSPEQPSSIRHFCGFCGTPLSYWTESPASEAEYINLTLGSLSSSDLRDLEDLGLLPEEALHDAEKDKKTIETVAPRAKNSGLAGEAIEGLPWFESMVEGSRLGKLKRTGEKREGRGWRVEWEIVEWTEGDDAETAGEGAPGKRKFGDDGLDGMEGVQGSN